MNKDLERQVQKMIDEGQLEEDIAIEIKKSTVIPKSIKKTNSIKDIVSKLLIFIVVSFLIWLIMMLIPSGIAEIVDINYYEIINIGAIINIPISLYMGYRVSKIANYKNTIKKLIDSPLLPYVLELVLPTILTSLFYILIDSRDFYEGETIIGFIGFLFFFIVVMEWVRRAKDKKTRTTNFKFLYVGLMLLVFILGVWYINQFE